LSAAPGIKKLVNTVPLVKNLVKLYDMARKDLASPLPHQLGNYKALLSSIFIIK